MHSSYLVPKRLLALLPDKNKKNNISAVHQKIAIVLKKCHSTLIREVIYLLALLPPEASKYYFNNISVGHVSCTSGVGERVLLLKKYLQI